MNKTFKPLERETEIVLGKRYRDRVSEWEGVATAKYLYLNGCTRVELSAKDDKGLPTGYVFDWQQLDIVVDAESVAPKTPARTGGPQTNVPVAR